MQKNTYHLPLYERSVGFASVPRQPLVPLHLCIDSHLCRCIVQRLCVAVFMHPCLKLWAFNFGHPCPSLVKGEVLSPEKIRATTEGIAFLPHPFRFSDTSVNNPSIVGSASHCNRSSPLHKGAKGDSALPTLPNPHYPTLSTTFLAPLPKGAGLRQGYFLL